MIFKRPLCAAETGLVVALYECRPVCVAWPFAKIQRKPQGKALLRFGIGTAAWISPYQHHSTAEGPRGTSQRPPPTAKGPQNWPQGFAFLREMLESLSRELWDGVRIRRGPCFQQNWVQEGVWAR